MEERAIVVGVKTKDMSSFDFQFMLEEIINLSKAAGAKILAEVVQQRTSPAPNYFIGKGKVVELLDLIYKNRANMCIFLNELTPAQTRNLEDALRVKVVDRVQIILDIFAQRARSKEGKLRVELAQLSYLLPRLVGKGKELSRLGGGIGTRGPGEKKLEIDRRKIKNRISKIKKELRKIEKRRDLERKARKRKKIPVVSLVGYTNAGKTTLLNRLTKSFGLVKDQPFTTLDPMVRRAYLGKDNEFVLISDTVGFVKNLPKTLLDAFKATMEEVLEADLILHVVDISSFEMEDEVEAVDRILCELGVDMKKVIRVFNKIDRLNRYENFHLMKKGDDRIFISALFGDGVDELKGLIRKRIHEQREFFTFGSFTSAM